MSDLAKQEAERRQALFKDKNTMLKSAEPTLTAALRAVGMDWESFKAEIQLVLAGNEKLLKADPKSFMGAVTKCARLGLVPGNDLNEIHLVPYWNGKLHAFTVQAQLGYNGLITLACRAGLAEGFESWVIYSRDDFTWNRTQRGLEFEHRELRDGDRGEPIAVAAVARLSGGGSVPILLWWEESIRPIQREAIRKFQAASKHGDKADTSELPWVKYEIPMGEKTAIRRLCNRLARSSRDRKLWAQVEAAERQAEADVVEGTVVASGGEDGEEPTPATDAPPRKALRERTPRQTLEVSSEAVPVSQGES